MFLFWCVIKLLVVHLLLSCEVGIIRSLGYIKAALHKKRTYIPVSVVLYSHETGAESFHRTENTQN